LVFFFFFALIYLGLLESFRLYYVREGNTIIQEIQKGRYTIAADISVFYQIPAYAIYGASEIFALSSTLEFAYSQTPNSMKSMIVAVFLFFC